jgi:hypothetical protein
MWFSSGMDGRPTFHGRIVLVMGKSEVNLSIGEDQAISH